MKSLASLFCLSSVMALASAAAVANPSGQIYVYTLPLCVGVGGVPIVNPKAVSLPLNQCVAAGSFTSFEGLVVNHCITGQATIQVFADKGCTGTALKSTLLPHDKLPTSCQQTLLTNKLLVGGYAKFTCPLKK